MKAIILIFIVFLVACIPPATERESYIGTVNGEHMPVAVYMIYLEEQIHHFERIGGGPTIWDADFGTQTAEQVAMEHALNNMALSIIIRNIAEESNISASEFTSSDDPAQEDFNESIAIREALMHYLTVAYAEVHRDTIFSNMEEAWLEEAIIIRNVTEWDKIRIER
ncbi:MAG: hypothetical protein FWE02_05755 [Defluviitaleaceae bacterium]|nr:hypothetical protein [Defluviitaleaceae bacterium]